MHVKTLECVVCGTRFSYTYTGGRKRRLCSESCRRPRKTAQRRVQRKWQDYPITVSTPPARPSKVIGTETRTDPKTHEVLTVEKLAPDPPEVRRRLMVESGDHGSPVPRRTVEEHERQTHPNNVFGPPDEAGNGGWGWDDHRDSLNRKLQDQILWEMYRWIPHHKRRAVHRWYEENGIPAPAYTIGSTISPSRPLFVLGSEKPQDDRSEVPPRVARRFCSENALEPLEPFCMDSRELSLFCNIREGRESLAASVSSSPRDGR